MKNESATATMERITGNGKYHWQFKETTYSVRFFNNPGLVFWE